MSTVKLKRVSLILVCFAILLSVGCRPTQKTGGATKEHEIFGIDLNALNPMVIWAENPATEEVAFSRDPSNISAVIKLFERAKREETETSAGKENGISFYMSTMYGNFNFGTSHGDRLWVDGQEFVLDKDYTSEIERLFTLIKSESDYIGIVERDTIDKIYPEMTYTELLDLFGLTKDTTVLSGGMSFLYQYNNYEFYINYLKEADPINTTPDELIKEIYYHHNLTFDPAVRERIDFSYEVVYDKLISSMLDEFFRHHKTAKIKRLVVDSTAWIGVNEERAEALKGVIAGNYELEVVDTTALNAYMKRELEPSGDLSETLFVGASHYSFIGESKANVTMRAVYPLEDGNYDFDKNFVLNKKDGSWFEVD